MSDGFAIVRASHVIKYFTVMRKIGIPVDRDLACSRLPPRMEEMPDLFVSLPHSLDWIAHSGSDLHPMQLGFLAAQEASLESLKVSHVAAIMAGPTGLKRLQTAAAVAHREDSALRLSMRLEAEGVRVICEFAPLDRHRFRCLADWLAVQAVVSIVRSVAGPHWCPIEISFASNYPLSKDAREAFGTTRMLVGQTCTSVLMESVVLTRPSRTPASDSKVARKVLRQQDLQLDPWTFSTLLRSAIQPYLNGGHLDLELAAGLVGMSRRTLQRRLHLSGQSYSGVMQDARSELARALLDGSSAKIIDVAMETGYESPQHFSRAFRRYTGLTPTAYRRISAIRD